MRVVHRRKRPIGKRLGPGPGHGRLVRKPAIFEAGDWDDEEEDDLEEWMCAGTDALT